MIYFVRSSIRYNFQIHPYIVQTMLISPYCEKITTENTKKTEDLCTISEIPEPPMTCCMSGCANCVWIEYAEKLTKIFHDGGVKVQKEIMDKVTDTNMKAFLSMEIRTMNLKNSDNGKKNNS